MFGQTDISQRRVRLSSLTRAVPALTREQGGMVKLTPLTGPIKTTDLPELYDINFTCISFPNLL